MAFISINIPPSLGEIMSHELQPVKSFGKEQNKMEEAPTSSPSNHSGHTENSLLKMENEWMMEVYIDLTLEINHRDKVPSKCKIYRVHGHLRNINDKAYEPEVIAIGPYHRGKDNLKMMEYHKKRYFTLIRMRGKKTFGEYYSAIRPLVYEARTCYADPIDLDETEFIKMLILDGCFIIELARKIVAEEHDQITCMTWMISSLTRDLMLFENQIPFFVLCKLFDLIKDPNQESSLIGLLTRFFKKYICHVEEDRESPIGLMKRFLCNICPGKVDRNRRCDEVRESSNRRCDEDRESSIAFLKRFFHNICHVKGGIESSNSCSVEGKERSPSEIKHLLHLVRINFVSSFESDLAKHVKYKGKWRFIESATWLTEANVKFKRNKGARSLFDIKFERGTLLLHPLRIEDRTESLLRNLIAYEQYFQDPESSYLTDQYNCVTDYVVFFDRLINSSGDAEILSRFGIVNNWLGDDEAVAQIFNKLTDSVMLGFYFIYGDIFDKVEKHCSKRRNRWMANLRRNYLHNPWAIISVTAAVVLLLLAVAQTVFSGLSLR